MASSLWSKPPVDYDSLEPLGSPDSVEPAGDFLGRETLGSILALYSQPMPGFPGVSNAAQAGFKKLGFTEDELEQKQRDALGLGAGAVVGSAVLAAGAVVAPVAGAAATVATLTTGGLAAAADYGLETFIRTEGDLEATKEAAIWGGIFGVGLGTAFRIIGSGAGKMLHGIAEQAEKIKGPVTLDHIVGFQKRLDPFLSFIDDKATKAVDEAADAAESEYVRQLILDTTYVPKSTKVIYKGRGSKVLEKGLSEAEILRVRNRAAGTAEMKFDVDDSKVLFKIFDDMESAAISEAARGGRQADYLVREARAVRDLWFDDTKAWLRNSDEFGKGGPVASKLIELQKQIEDMFTAESEAFLMPFIKAAGRKGGRWADQIIRGEIVGPKNGIDPPKKVTDLVRAWRQYTEGVFETTKKLRLREWNPSTGELTPVKFRHNYAPEQHDIAKLRKHWAKNPRDKQKAIIQARAMMEQLDTTKATSGSPGMRARNFTDEEVLDFLEALAHGDHWTKRTDIRAPGLQFARILHMDGFERNPRIYMRKYARQTASRMSFARVFGAQDEVAEMLINHAEQTSADAGRKLRDVFSVAAGRPPIRTDKLTGWVQNAAVVGMLGFQTALIQTTQLIPTLIQFGFRSSINAFVQRTFNRDAMDAVRRSGALLPSAIDPMLGITTTKYIKAVGITGVDGFFRGHAALAASIHANETAARFYRATLNGNTNQIKRFGRSLQDLGQDLRKIREAKGILDDGDMLLAMREGSRMTQFTSELADLPFVVNSNPGKWFWLFRKFTFQYQKFFKKQVYDEAIKHGNLRPFLRFMVAAPAVSDLVNYVKQRFRGEEVDFQTLALLESIYTKDIINDQTPLWDLMKTTASLGMFGFYGDIAREAIENPDKGRLVGFLAGPGVGASADIAVSLGKAAIDEDLDPIGELLNRIGPGSSLYPNEEAADQLRELLNQ